MYHRSGRTGPIGAHKETDQLYYVLARANQIASSTELDELLDQMLDLIILICGGNAGTLYLIDKTTKELVFTVVKGDEESQRLVNQRMPIKSGIVGAAVQQITPLVVDDLATDPRWFHPEGSSANLKNTIAVPLLLRGAAIGVIQVFNFTHKPLQMIQLLGNRMASEIEKAILLQASERRGERLEALVSIIGEISSTLDRDLILNLIIENARVLLHAEACSLFLLDETTGDLVLHIARDMHHTQLPPVRIPAGQGLIGHVVQTGESALVLDAQSDPRHFGGVDDISGIQTRSVLAVPLMSQPVILGEEAGTTQAHIIGGLETINRIEGHFTQEDAQLLHALANQAATVLHIANLYADANELFLDTIKALVAAVDAKDPYTEGHSQRVSEFSVAIAQQLNLPQEMIQQVRIGSLLHDVGKIGIQDSILLKPGPLDDEEYLAMKKHPVIGATIMGKVRMLQDELPALDQHHERIDGKGYPSGLQGDQISLIGRIVAVADVFDAITSERPYRQGVSAQEGLRMLQEDTRGHLDLACVQGLVEAYHLGKIKTQKGHKSPNPSSSIT
jgi:HD-GYP domain-containing protein (c-di-GMP phosphodiesterase class II)